MLCSMCICLRLIKTKQTDFSSKLKLKTTDLVIFSIYFLSKCITEVWSKTELLRLTLVLSSVLAESFVYDLDLTL